MKKFLFEINSTSWFQTIGDRVIKLEVFLLIMMFSTMLVFGVVAFEFNNDLPFSWRSKLAAIPFLLFGGQYILYSILGKPASKEIEDHFWKTQLWRFKDPRYNLQESFYNEKYNVPEGRRISQLEFMWLDVYEETSDESYARRYKFVQKFRMWILIALVFLATFIGYNL